MQNIFFILIVWQFQILIVLAVSFRKGTKHVSDMGKMQNVMSTAPLCSVVYIVYIFVTESRSYHFYHLMARYEMFADTAWFFPCVMAHQVQIVN